MENIVTLDRIVGGGQVIGTLEAGKKVFLWGGLPGETVKFRVTKKRSKMLEGVVTEVLTPSQQRIEPVDPDSYLSTSPWQIMDFASEQQYKSQLIDEAFELHGVTLPRATAMYSDKIIYTYRNKVEFSWWGDEDENGHETLDLAFFRRGGRGKIPVQGTSLARPEINKAAQMVRDVLREAGVHARQLKTLLVRANQRGDVVWQLYCKDEDFLEAIDLSKLQSLDLRGGEIIYSDPKSPASKITKRLVSFGDTTLTDTLLGVSFRYATEGFFQINLPVYTQTLETMKSWIPAARPTLDLYSGVGSIGLTIGGEETTLVEIDEHAVREMQRNITDLGSKATAVLSPSERAIDHITSDKTIIVDPPRAGLHSDVVDRLNEIKPSRIIYLSCNPVTQARDVSLLLENYKISHHEGFNYFPRTPHIEHLVVLDLK